MDENFIFFHIDIQWAQYHLLKRSSFAHCSIVISLYKLSDSVCVGQFLESLLNSIGFFNYPYDNTMLPE